MSARNQEINLQLNQILDSLLIALAFWLSHTLRYQGYYLIKSISWLESFFIFERMPQIPEFRNFIWLMFIVVPFTPIVLEFQGFYRHPLQKTLGMSIRQILRTFLWIGVAIAAFVIFFKWAAESRAVLLILPVIGGGMLLAKEGCMKALLKRRIEKGEWRERVVLAGRPADVDALLEAMPVEHRSEIEIVDRIDISVRPIGDLVQSFSRNNVERVLIAAGHVHFNKVEEVVNACETEGVEAWLAADFLRTSIARPDFDVVGRRPMLVFRSTPSAPWALVFKDLMDRSGAFLLLVLSAPLWVLAYVGIKCTSPGPAIFVQERGGRYGRPFRMFKFRTMAVNAEASQSSLQEGNEMSGPVFKLENDPRVFRFGSLLRRWSIDELPQLLNILKGEMSLVGPRPLPIYEVHKIEKSAQRRRLSVKPGLTCLWQVHGRNQITDFEDWVRLDLEYIDNWSIWLDFRILFRTIPVVVMGAGAR